MGQAAMHVLALDVGTSAVKAAVLEVESASPVAKPSHAPYRLERPAPGAAIIPPERLWDAVSRAARDAVAAASGIGVEGVGFSCMTPALLLLDGEYQPLTPIWTHFDRRSRPIARAIKADPAKFRRFLEHACNAPLPGGMSGLSAKCQLELEPSLRQAVRHYAHANGWLAWRLTGKLVFDPANACFTGLYTARGNAHWSKEWCAEFGIPLEWLPAVQPGEETLGPLLADAARAWNLPTGIPVKHGTADTSSAMLAAEMGPDDLLHVVGTTQVLAAYADPPAPNERRLVRPLGVGSRFIHVTHNPVGGEALNWLFDLCYSGGRDPASPECRAVRERYYAEVVLGDALHHETAVELEPPFLGGDRLEIEDRAAAFTNLKLSVKPIDLVAAVLKGMRRGHSQAFQNLGLNRRWRRLFLTGGGAEVVKSLDLAEYRGIEIHPLEEGSLRGVARLFN
jgi:sugar (pentulose or hexulose) kinase